MTPAEIHNRDAGAIVASIVRPTIQAGGQMTDVLVLLESVCAGVPHVAVKLGGDKDVLEVFTQGLAERMARLRLEPIKPEGSA